MTDDRVEQTSTEHSAGRLMPRQAYCSWCFDFSLHCLCEQNWVRRDVYRCQTCNNYTLKCRYCPNMAMGRVDPNTCGRPGASFVRRIADRWDNELCAEHDGTIASFPGLSRQLDDVEDYDIVFRREKWNLLRGGKIAAIGIGGVVIFVPAAYLAAPAVASALGSAGMLGAASTGTVISTLEGAALTSASLAFIGGGTMAGGTILLTAAGGALGGVAGAVIGNRYFGEVRDFAIKKLNEGIPASNARRSAVIFINGFLSQKGEETRDWRHALRDHQAGDAWYLAAWEAKCKYELGSLCVRDISGHAAKMFAVRMAKRASKKAGTRMNPVTMIANIADLLGNPWHVAMVKAAMTGILLADLMARTRDQEFILMGHSLGARVVYYALEALSTRKTQIVRDAYLFGGAIGRSSEGWTKAADAVSGQIHNCFSTRDKVLTYLYQGFNAGLSNPVGIGPINGGDGRIRDHDFSSLILSHMDWKRKLSDVLEVIKGRNPVKP